MKNNFLTSRELNIFNMLVKNESTKDIAQELSISEKTVRNHVSNLLGQRINGLTKPFLLCLYIKMTLRFQTYLGKMCVFYEKLDFTKL